MPPKKRGQPQPRIVEIDNEEDLKNFDIPQETLYEQINRLNQPTQQAPTQQATVKTDGDEELELDAVGKAMFSMLDYTAYLIPLLSVHLTLNVLVRMQYGQEVDTPAIFQELASTVPVILILHKFFHPYKSSMLFKIASFAVSVVIGSYLLYVSNEEGYYFVMKRAPPLGTLWVWLFVEMDWNWSALSLALVGVYMYACDYSF